MLVDLEAGRSTEPQARARLDEVFALRARLAAAVGEADGRRAVQLARTQVAERTASQAVYELLRELFEAAARMQPGK